MHYIYCQCNNNYYGEIVRDTLFKNKLKVYTNINFSVFLDDEAVKREEEAIKLDGLNVAQIKELREKSEKFTFQAEVNRMMKLIINSLYRNKEVHRNVTLFLQLKEIDFTFSNPKLL